MAADPKTLDIREPQVIIHFPADAGGFFWHHRILLEKCSPGIWIGVSPDGDLERIDLSVTQHITLDRKADFPGPQAPFVYAFDPLTRGELEGYRRRAKTMNNLFNDAAIEEVVSYVWIIADPSHADFGRQVDESLIDEGVTLRDAGIVEYEGDEIYVKRIAFSSKDQWITDKVQAKGDLRLLGEFRDGLGKRFLEFKSAVDKLRSSDMKDWDLRGPRACSEFLRAVRLGTGDLTSYHLNWAQHLGVSTFGAAFHEHRVLTDALRAFLSVDQLDVSNLLGVEILVRRIIQIETAVARNPTSPDYSGLDVVMEQSIGAGGEAQVGTFNEWVSSKLKERSQIQKQARLYREEFRHKGATDASDGDRGRGRGKGGGRPTPKGKSAAASSAAAGQG